MRVDTPDPGVRRFSPGKDCRCGGIPIGVRLSGGYSRGLRWFPASTSPPSSADAEHNTRLTLAQRPGEPSRYPARAGETKPRLIRQPGTVREGNIDTHCVPDEWGTKVSAPPPSQPLDTFSATAARMSAFRASPSTWSPSWKSMARLWFPSRLALKRCARVIERRAHGKRELDRALVSFAGADQAAAGPARDPKRVGGLLPFALLDDLGIGFPDQRAEAGKHLSAPVGELLDSCVDQAGGGFDAWSNCLIHRVGLPFSELFLQ